MQVQTFQFSFVDTIRGVLLLSKPPIRRAAFSIVKNFYSEYHAVQKQKSSVMYDVELPLDKKIPYWGNAWVVYLGYGFTLVSFLGKIYFERGKETLFDIEKFLIQFSEFYIDAGIVFRKVPTSFTRSGGGWFSKLFRSFIDGDRNAAPSVHVIQAAFLYAGCRQLLKKYGMDHHHEIELRLLNVSSRVVDATMLVKQHCLIDVATGLAMVAKKYPELSSDMEIIIDHLFSFSKSSVDQKLIGEVKSEIRKIFLEVIKTPGPCHEVLCKYVPTLPHRILNS